MSKESALKVLHELTAAGLLSSDAVTRFGQEIESGSEALLAKLVDDEVITQYQATKFHEGKASDICFGDYLIINELGRGGMGTVFLARHQRMDREVAIKVLPVTTMESKSSVARFYQEVKVAARLKHPNIVHAYDAGEHQGFHYLVMEYVEGHDLAHVCHEIGPLPLDMVLDYVRQTCQGLFWAHSKQVIHRDIKPSNLLLDGEGNIKILDMGLARFGKSLNSEDAADLTTTGQVMGTVEYMSPEQAEDTRLADERSDIYSLGCTLYRLLGNTGPFTRNTVVKTILAHRNDPIPELPATGDPRQSRVQRIFEKMLAKAPVDRYASVERLLEDLEDLDGDADDSYYESFQKHDELVEAELVHSGSLGGDSLDSELKLEPPVTINLNTSDGSTAEQLPKNPPAIRIEDDGSITQLGQDQPVPLFGKQVDSQSQATATASTGEIFRIEDDASRTWSRGHRKIVGYSAFLLLLLVSFAMTSLIGLVVGLFFWIRSHQKMKHLKAAKSVDRAALRSARTKKWAGGITAAMSLMVAIIRGF